MRPLSLPVHRGAGKRHGAEVENVKRGCCRKCNSPKLVLCRLRLEEGDQAVDQDDGDDDRQDVGHVRTHPLGDF